MHGIPDGTQKLVPEILCRCMEIVNTMVNDTLSSVRTGGLARNTTDDLDSVPLLALLTHMKLKPTDIYFPKAAIKPVTEPVRALSSTFGERSRWRKKNVAVAGALLH